MKTENELKKKKPKEILYYRIVMLLPLLFTITCYGFLPEAIPAHFNANNEVTRWGSRWELLIFPMVVLLFGFFLQKIYEDKPSKKTFNKGMLGLGVFCVLQMIMLVVSFTVQP